MPYKFTPNKWVIFDCQDGKTAIGYTTYRASKPIVVFASDAGKTGTLPFEKVIRPRLLYVESRGSNDIRQSIENLPDVMINFNTGKA